MVDHFHCTWKPPQVWQDPVWWMRRCQNRVADGLVDLTMDTRRYWRKGFAKTEKVSDANLVVQTDGGLRDGDCATA
eukprot:5960274-Karenia_brevis.AAC.1